MKRILVGSFLSLSLLMATYAHAANVNGYKATERVFNDDPSSTLTITPGAPINSNPANIVIHDEYTGPFSGSNRNDVLASTDGGGFPHTFSIDDSFIFTTQLTLTDGFDAPRKEAGIRINSPVTGDALFLVNSDAGEIVTFGGGAPFGLLGKNADGNGYTPGNTITLGIRHIASNDGSGGNPNKIEFFVDQGSGIETTGLQDWANLEGGPVAFTVGVYAQGGSSNQGDFVNAMFENTTFTMIPEPTSLALAGLSLVGLLGMRRRARPEFSLGSFFNLAPGCLHSAIGRVLFFLRIDRSVAKLLISNER